MREGTADRVVDGGGGGREGLVEGVAVPAPAPLAEGGGAVAGGGEDSYTHTDT